MSPIDDLPASVHIEDGKLSVSDDGVAKLYLESPEYELLSRGQTRLTLRVVGDDFESEVRLDSDDVQALRAAIEEVA